MQEQTIFTEALEKGDPAERAAFLDQACAGNPFVRQRVERLLQRHELGGSLLQAPANLGATVDEPPRSERPGTVIGPYKLLQQIGEGGMGTVWMAEQTRPVQRRVALKIIKPGMDSSQVIARFEAERQALALMDHPNIAKVLDAGTTDAGRPYFVMELVKGVPITKYCDEHHLTPKERLELFIPVCQAVQHAHQKGIIHRDLKPSNVLIGLYDGRPVPKVIDFGVAKATEQKLTERTLFTQYGTMIGTLEYMSPEQAEMSALGVDTRSDIYSLGVLLYELLTGSTPLTHKRMKEAAYAEILRMIKEEEPPKPSTRLSDSGEALASISANRHTEPAKLTKLVRGELDWIVMKCLEKDRNRRYETAKDFAADVQRYLSDETVQACPPSVGYRLRKFARRNKAALTMAAVITLALVLVVASFGWMVRDREAQNEQIARDKAAREEQNAHDQAARQLVIEQALSRSDEFLKEGKWQQSLMEARRAEAALAGGPADVGMRHRTAERLKDLQLVGDLEDLRDGGWDPDRKTVTTYSTLFREYGIDVNALAADEAGARIRERAIRNFLVGALDYWAMEGRRYWAGPPGNGKEDAEPKRLKRQLLAITRVADPDEFRNRIRDALAENDGATLLKLAGSVRSAELTPPAATLLAKALFSVGERDGAIMILRQVQPRYPDDLELTSALASYFWKNPKTLLDGIRYYQAALALRPRSLGLSANLAMALEMAGRQDEALLLRQGTTELHPRNPYAQSNLGTALLGMGKLPEAVAAFKEAIRLQSNMDAAHHNLGVTYSRLGQIEPAIVSFRRTIELNPNHAEAHAALGSALAHIGKLKEAETHCRRAIELKPKYATAHNNLGAALVKQNRIDEAIDCLRSAVELSPKFTAAYINLGNALGRQGRLEEANACFRTVVEFAPPNAAVLNSLAWNLATCADLKLRSPAEAVKFAEASTRLTPQDGGNWNTLGVARFRAGENEAAVAALTRSMQLSNGGTAFDWFFLAMAQQRLGKKEEARKWFDRAVQWMEKNQPRDEELLRFRPQAEEILGIKKDSK